MSAAAARAPGKTSARMRFAVVRFPGSNCDQDAYFAVRDKLEYQVEYVWHEETNLDRFDVVILPGGFSYGDYLRTGAVARFSPVVAAIERHASRGKLVFGICNGFQVLCECGLLPGALVRNDSCKFVCKLVTVRADAVDTPFTCACRRGELLRIPVAHGEGRYVCDDSTLDALHRESRVVFRYVDDRGDTTPASNPNGSVDSIAGIVSERRNVLGMMPHPERAVDSLLGSTSGLRIFRSIVQCSA